MKTMKLIILCLAGLALVGCGSKRGDGVWCNERYLDKVNAEKRVADVKHLNVAKTGYMYALASAYVLQKDNSEGRANWFQLPPRLEHVESLTEYTPDTGFKGDVFVLYTDAARTVKKELIVAFTGSDEAVDYRETNFSDCLVQYVQARWLLSRAAAKPEYAGLPIVVAGNSLGGGLAVHVSKHKDTKDLVAAAWAFNPSPKTYVDEKVDPRIWLVATDKEILGLVRGIHRLVPGGRFMGAPESHTATDYYLITSNPMYAHSRWVLVRNILHIADLALLLDSNGAATTTEPLEILGRSYSAACAANKP